MTTVAERQGVVKGSARPLRIAFVSEELPPETGWGGIGTYTDILSRALAARGHDVTVVARSWERDSRQRIDGVDVVRLVVEEPSWRRRTAWLTERFYETGDMIRWARRVASALRRMHAESSFDVVEAPEYHAQVFLLPTGLPLVVRLHTPAFVNREVSGIRVGGSVLDTRIAERLEHLVTRRSRLVTSPTNEMLDRVRSRWRITRPAAVVPNPVDVARFDSVLPPPSGPPTILYVGRVSRRKGVEHLIDALPDVLRAVPTARLRLVGKDHPAGADGASMAEHLRRRLARLGVPDGAVTFEGYQDRDALVGWYAGSTVCVVPSLYESFGYTCVEAMASGRALVASAVGGIPEVVTDGVDGLLVPPADPRRLAEAIVRVLTDDAGRREMEAQARRRARDRFGVDVVTDQFVDLYTQLALGARR